MQKVQHGGTHNLQFLDIMNDSKSALMHPQMLHVGITLSNLLEVHLHVSIGTLLVCEVRTHSPTPPVDNDPQG